MKKEIVLKLYVGNLSWGVTNDQLRTGFEEFGNVVDAKVVTDRETGRSRGFGFVEMSNQEEGNNAIKEMNNKTWEGRPLTVNQAQPKSEGGQRRSGGGGQNRRW